MKRRRLAALVGVFALTLGASGAALATQPTGHKITICHATSSEKNPYVSPTVDIASAGYDGSTSGHAGHGRDGVWYPGAKSDGFDWGDIIPPYDYGDFHYAGLNWTEAGEAIYENGCTVPDEPDHDPKIQIEKTPSVTDLPAGGGEVTYTYVVTATGSNVPLSDVTVSDDKCSPVTYVSGDTNGDEFLDPSESWTFTCHANLTETTTNTAVATGHDGDDTVTDDDDATVTVAQPESNDPSSPPSSEPSDEPSAPPPGEAGIDIQKTADPTTIEAGDDITYTYIVTNTGDIDLDPVTVWDDNGTPGGTSDDFQPDCDATKLAVGEYMTCTAIVSGTQVTTTNIAVATGVYGEDKEVSDDDDATVTVGEGGVEAETDAPTGPPTDSVATTATDVDGALPLFLIVLGAIGIGAVVLTPKRAMR